MTLEPVCGLGCRAQLALCHATIERCREREHAASVYARLPCIDVAEQNLFVCCSLEVLPVGAGARAQVLPTIPHGIQYL